MKEDCFHLGIKALIMNEEGKILLLKVNKEKLRNYSGEAYWDIPGGRIHKNSTIEETLEREIEEETGLTEIVSYKKVDMVLSNNIRIPIENGETVGLILAIYICSVSGFEKISLSDEHTEYGWFSSEEAAKLLEIKYPHDFTNKIPLINQNETNL